MISSSAFALAICLSIISNNYSTFQVKRACKMMPYIVEQSSVYGVDPILVASIIEIESSWNPKSVSNKGACGLMQVVPKWNPSPSGKKYTCEQLKEPKLNIKVGIRALSRWQKAAKGDTSLTLCAYNAGNVCFTRIRTKYYRKVEEAYLRIISTIPL